MSRARHEGGTPTVLALWGDETERIGVVTFTVDGYPAELVAQYLSAEHGIGVRDGRVPAFRWEQNGNSRPIPPRPARSRLTSADGW